MRVAWHTAALSREPKRLPKLETLQVRKPGAPEPWQKHLVAAQLWARRGVGRMGKLN